MSNFLAIFAMQWAVGVERKPGFADMLIALSAKETVAARSDQGNHDMIARFHRHDPRANFIDYSSSLVSIHRWDFTTPTTVHENNIAVANGTGGDLDLDLARLRCIDFECFDDQWFTVFSAHSSFHNHTSWSVRNSRRDLESAVPAAPK